MGVSFSVMEEINICGVDPERGGALNVAPEHRSAIDDDHDHADQGHQDPH